MSGYYVGPFGRILPVPEDSSALEDAQDDASLPKRLTNYHLPPPRKPVALQFGSDTTLGPPESIDSSDSAMNRVPSQDNGSRHQPQDTLPSVSQILTPASFPGTPSPSYPYAGRGNSPLNSAGTHRSPIGETYDRTTQQAGYSNHGLVSDARTGSVPESIDTSYGHKQYTSYNRDQLPPLSQVGLDPASLRAQHFREYARNSSDAPLARYHQGQLPYLRELSNSEISSASNPSSFTGETSLRSGSPTGQNQLRVAHVVDERVIEGEGLCYIYSDGSHCPKLIDGELVNSNWGITKAGKPRKRLAQACITCRDKKIKCIPNTPKCEQCQKSGRECRFENAPRGNQAAKNSQQSARSSADPMGHDLSSISHGQSAAYVASGYSNSGMSLGGIVDMSPTPGRSQDPGPLMHEAAGRGPGFDRPLKRRRRASTNPIGAAGEDSKPEKDRARASDSYGMSDILSEMAAMDMHDPTLSEWETDPYQTDPESTMHYVDLYFRWLRFCPNKSPDDKMLLYAMLAMGAIFSTKKEQRTDAMRFARIARHAVEKSQNQPTLHLAQTRIILGMWHFTIGASATASDFTGSAMRTICGLKLNVEHAGPSAKGSREWEQFFEEETLMECQRRTFWAAFLMDRHTSLPIHSPTVLKPQDIFLRLPLRSDWYENQKWATMPYFENGIIPADPSLPEERGALDPMAFLVEISAVWGDVLENAYRSSYISSANYPKHFEEFYESTIKRADKWIASLPSYFTYSAGNMQRSIQAGQTDVFASVHILYHATMMRLNRHTRCDDIPEAITQRNARRSHYHCVEILRIALDLRHLLDTNQTEGPTTPSAAPRNTFSTPLTGNAIISATDVLSAAGYMRDAPYYLTLINAGLDLITEVAKFWHTAREQLRVMQPRVARITEAINTHAKRGGDKLGFAVEGRALDVILIDRVMPTDERGSSPGHGNNPAAAKRGDLVYALSREAYFHALGFTDISVERGDVLWIPCPDDTS
ncbi:hypothetical protein FQN52_000986 [Onygenales sp. PD_12]|nr:hypothetical protein FQN52_000986 [Onygenales sp. PD_12]